ncbi:MAG TPA: pyridoxamine 5'-phosphate oxidase [Kofleriaceae bacterium]|jgi:pyridoxamine 5'-phosphate oxidase|nr:pyridoxamine 5'-phosphate oxidase [Kofleriaceae bacterium]
MAKDLLWRHGEQYEGARLDVASALANPLEQFRAWFADAEATGLKNVNAMTLATATRDGRPSARTVLLKEIDERGFVFYTNYTSRKSLELDANPRAALLFYWLALDRQVRIDGVVERVSAEESDAYFATRPLESRLGAIASPQSQVIASREELEAWVENARAVAGDAPPRPPHWGGYRVIPEELEFWQGQPSRLHDRVRYRRDGAGAGAGAGWVRERLAP